MIHQKEYSMWQKTVIALGRILLAAIFIIGALSKIFNWNETLQQLESVFSDLRAYVGSSIFDMVMPFASVLLVVAIALELIGGASILIGYKPKWGALCLILFLIPTTLVVHHFWFLEGQARAEEQMAFAKNCAILGGLLVLWGHSSIFDKKYANF